MDVIIGQVNTPIDVKQIQTYVGSNTETINLDVDNSAHIISADVNLDSEPSVVSEKPITNKAITQYVNNSIDELDASIDTTLINYVKKTDYGSDTDFGIVKTGGTTKGITVDVDNFIVLSKATEQEIVAQENEFKPIVPKTISVAVRQGLTNPATVYTDIEKTQARATLDVPSNSKVTADIKVETDRAIEAEEQITVDLAEVEQATTTLRSDFDSAIADVYTKEESDSKYPSAEETYTKTETDNKFPLKINTYTKEETDAKYPVKENVYTKTESDDAFELKGTAYSKAESDNNFADKANTYTKSEVYTKTESDNNYPTKASVYTKTEVDNGFETKGTSYTKADSDTKYPLKEDVYTKTKSDDNYPAKADVYTKIEADNLFPTKLITYTKSDVYNKTESDTNFATKSDVYTKVEVDNNYYTKSNVYTKTEADNLFPTKTITYTKTESDLKYCNALRKTATGIEQLTINDATANPVTRMVIAGYSEQSYTSIDPFPKPTDSGYKQINNLIDVSFDFNATSYNIPLKLLSLGVGSAATDGNTKDEYNVITGTGSRKVGEKIWNGTEGWAAHSTPTITTLDGSTGYVYRYSNSDFGTVSGSSNTGERFALCTYLRQGFGSFASSNNIFPVNSIYGFASASIVFVILDSNFPTVNHWTDFLASKATTDKPCRVLYKKSTPTTITSTPINISTVLGVNRVTGLLGGSDITITYNRDINSAISELAAAIAALQAGI